jgi:hypothetical protein
MRSFQHITIGALLVASVLTGCNKQGEEDTTPKTYTATAYLEVLPLAEGGLVAETLESLAMPERVAAEIKLAQSYELARDLFTAPGQQVTHTAWYQGIEGGDPNEALAAVMEIHPATHESTWIGVSVTLTSPEEAALLANAAAMAIEARSAESVVNLYDRRIGELWDLYERLEETIFDGGMNVDRLEEELDGELHFLRMRQAELLDRRTDAMEFVAEAEAVIDSLTTLEGDDLLAVPMLTEALQGFGDYQSLLEMLQTMEVALRAQVLQYGEDHELVQSAAEQIEIMQTQLAQMQAMVVDDLLAEAREKVAIGEGDLDQLEAAADALVAEFDGVADLEETLVGLRDQLFSDKQQLFETEQLIDLLQGQAGTDRRLKLVQEAAVPTVPN